MFATDLVIFHDYLFDASVNVDYKVTIDETDVILPVGKDATAYPASISGKKAIWNWVEHGHDFCFYIWDILGGRMNRDEDDTESEPSYWGFDAYDQYRGENAEPQLVKIFHKLESLGYIKTFTINPDDGSPRWVYYGKPNGSIDVALVDMTFLKNKLVTEQIEVLLWSTEADIMGKPYLLTDSNNVQVKVDFREDGVMLPREIIWEDGVTYEIDRVIDIRQAAAMKAGGQGDRYTIVVRGKRSYLFFERSTNQTGNNIGRWFVERRVA